MTLVDAAISIAISLAVFIVFSALLEAGRRRGMDPVADIARMLSPNVADAEEGAAQ